MGRGLETVNKVSQKLGVSGAMGIQIGQGQAGMQLLGRRHPHRLSGRALFMVAGSTVSKLALSLGRQTPRVRDMLRALPL